jgi:hypothetical protein
MSDRSFGNSPDEKFGTMMAGGRCFYRESDGKSIVIPDEEGQKTNR